jgi:hypothetical protein
VAGFAFVDESTFYATMQVVSPTNAMQRFVDESMMCDAFVGGGHLVGCVDVDASLSSRNAVAVPQHAPHLVGAGNRNPFFGVCAPRMSGPNETASRPGSFGPVIRIPNRRGPRRPWVFDAPPLERFKRVLQKRRIGARFPARITFANFDAPPAARPSPLRVLTLFQIGFHERTIGNVNLDFGFVCANLRQIRRGLNLAANRSLIVCTPCGNFVSKSTSHR